MSTFVIHDIAKHTREIMQRFKIEVKAADSY